MRLTAFPEPVVCWPWHLRFQGPDHYATGKNCFVCNQDVAALKDAARPICLYCGMERGIVPLEEIDDSNPEHLARSPWVRVPTQLDLIEYLTAEK